MFNAQRFSFQTKTDLSGLVDYVPYLPLTLTYQNRTLEVMGLLDTGASVNVLPYQIGLQLGAVWERQNISIPLAGNLSQQEAKGLLVSAKIGQFPTVKLVFAWAKVDNIPLLLGRTNFFAEFHVCFYGSELAFEICPKSN
jgi:hypothetical protein